MLLNSMLLNTKCFKNVNKLIGERLSYNSKQSPHVYYHCQHIL